MHKLLVLFYFFTCFTTFAQSPSQAGKIKIKVTELENVEGFLHISLFNSEEGFPSDDKAPLLKRKLMIDKNIIELEFENIPYGTYAIAILHDENGNGEMDTNLIGIPKEGVGVSNNAVRSFGPPKFEDCKFKLNTKELALAIKMHYY